MNHEETIKRIQELVPSVMALEFGCEVLAQEKYSPVGFLMPMTVLSVNESVREIDTTLYTGLSYDDIITILGKPITLAIVLLAITEYKELQMTFAEAEKEDMGDDWGRIMYGFRDMNWNLSKDNFNDQSEETKTFIGNLLNNE